MVIPGCLGCSETVSHMASSTPCAVQSIESEGQKLEVNDPCLNNVTLVVNDERRPLDVVGSILASKDNIGMGSNMPRRTRMSSCPPRVVRYIVSGPWSMEWLNNHNYGDASVILSKKKKKRSRR